MDDILLHQRHSERELERALMAWKIKINRQMMNRVQRGMARLVEQFAGSVRLDGDTKMNLARLGYGI